jgi:hypothetical protein
MRYNSQAADDQVANLILVKSINYGYNAVAFHPDGLYRGALRRESA